MDSKGGISVVNDILEWCIYVGLFVEGCGWVVNIDVGGEGGRWVIEGIGGWQWRWVDSDQGDGSVGVREGQRVMKEEGVVWDNLLSSLPHHS